MSRFQNNNEESQDLNVRLLSYRDENINDLGYNQDNYQQEEQKSVEFQEMVVRYSENQLNQSNTLGQNNKQSLFSESLQQKQQPFMTQPMKKQLQGFLLKDGYELSKEISSNLLHALFKGYSKKIKKKVCFQIIKCTQEDYIEIKNRIEKIIGIDTLQFVQKYYNILFYPELFMSVIVQDLYKSTLKEELQQNDGFTNYQKNQLIFQVSHALTEIHSYNIIHYSLSPSTIFKSQDGNYKLSFFDKFTLLKSRQLLDSYDQKYTSPEISLYLNDKNCKFDILNSQVDVYSLGVIIMEVIKSNTKKSNNSHQKQYIYKPENIIQSENQNKEIKIDNNSQSVRSSKKEIVLEERFSVNKSFCFSNVEDSDAQSGNVSSKILKRSLEANQEFDQFQIALLNPNPSQRLNSFEVFNKLLQFIQVDQFYINSILSSIYRSLKVDIFSRNKSESYLKQLRINYSELRLKLIIELPQNQKLPETSFYCYKNTALLYIQNSEYSKGLEYSLHCIEIINQNNNQNDQQALRLIIKDNLKESINLQIVVSLCYEKLKQYEKSLEHSKMSYELAKQQDPENYDLYIFGKSCCRLSWAYYRLKDGQNAILYAQESLQAYQQLNKNKFILCEVEAYDALGCAYELSENYEESILMYQKSLELRQSLLKWDHPAIAQSYYNLGLMYVQMEQYKEALQNFITSASLYKLHKGRFVSQIKQSYTQVQQILANLKEQDLVQEIAQQIDQLSSENKD